MYYCPDCDTETEAPAIDKLKLKSGEIVEVEVCPTCGSDIVESYECPIHGTNAPDGLSNCAKCG